MVDDTHSSHTQLLAHQYLEYTWDVCSLLLLECNTL